MTRHCGLKFPGYDYEQQCKAGPQISECVLGPGLTSADRRAICCSLHVRKPRLQMWLWPQFQQYRTMMIGEYGVFVTHVDSAVPAQGPFNTSTQPISSGRFQRPRQHLPSAEHRCNLSWRIMMSTVFVIYLAAPVTHNVSGSPSC